MKKLALVLFVAIAFGTGFSTVAVGQYELEKAFKAAALPADAKGRWVVKTDVNIYKLDGTKKLEASGNLELKGNVLEGNLNLRPPGGAFINANTMYLYVTKPSPATMRVRHDIAGKPFMGRPAEVVKLETAFRAPFLRGKVVWDNEECDVSIFLAPEQTKDKPKPAFPNPDPIPAGKTPIGARYQVTGLMDVTNAEDGVLDNTCYIYGTVSLWLMGPDSKYKFERELFTLIPQDAMKGFKLNFDKNIYINRYYDNKYWNRMSINGSIQDQDGGVVDQSDDDLLWQGGQAFRFGGINDPVGTVKNFVVPGDRSSENAEVYVKLTLVEKLYTKP